MQEYLEKLNTSKIIYRDFVMSMGPLKCAGRRLAEKRRRFRRHFQSAAARSIRSSPPYYARVSLLYVIRGIGGR